jgi:hypothetical protein
MIEMIVLLNVEEYATPIADLPVPAWSFLFACHLPLRPPALLSRLRLFMRTAPAVFFGPLRVRSSAKYAR